MANECRKANQRRLHEPAFHQRFFVGEGIDVGAGDDSLGRYAFAFPRISHVCDWNHSNGDGTDLQGLAENAYDFLHSSHSLEHMRDPYVALARWIQVVKPNGHLIITVPDFGLYEHSRWPSDNHEHTHAFTLGATEHPWLINVLHLVTRFSDVAHPIKIERQEYAFDFSAEPYLDQTCFGSGASESAIEIVLRKL